LLEAAEADVSRLRQALAEAGAAKVAVVTGALEKGQAAGAPYDVILIEGLIDQRPDALLDQLADGGRLVTVERISGLGRAILYNRSGDDIGRRTVFDASAPELAAFRPAPAFSF